MNLSRGQGLTREIRVLKKAFLASLLTSHYLHIYALYTIIQIFIKNNDMAEAIYHTPISETFIQRAFPTC